MTDEYGSYIGVGAGFGLSSISFRKRIAWQSRNCQKSGRHRILACLQARPSTAPVDRSDTPECQHVPGRNERNGTWQTSPLSMLKVGVAGVGGLCRNPGRVRFPCLAWRLNPRFRFDGTA